MGNILVTGANGYLGSQFVLKLLEDKINVDQKIICLDIHFRPEFLNNPALLCIKMDIRSNELNQIISDNHIETVVHLAAIISTPDKSDREKEYDIDVNGTKNLVKACIENNVLNLSLPLVEPLTDTIKKITINGLQRIFRLRAIMNLPIRTIKN